MGRAGLYRLVQERLVDLVPWVPLAHSEYVSARKELGNVVLSPLGHPDATRVIALRKGQR